MRIYTVVFPCLVFGPNTAQTKNRFGYYSLYAVDDDGYCDGGAMAGYFLGQRGRVSEQFASKSRFDQRTDSVAAIPELYFGNHDFVSLWGSLGVGFLGMLSGVLNINSELYEAAYIDGLKNRFQEIIYITIPMMKPQMLFGAVMSVVSTFSAGAIGVQLTGSNPTPQYAGQLIYNHIEDFGFIQYEMGYAAAVSVILLLLVMLVSKISYRLFGTRD